MEKWLNNQSIIKIDWEEHNLKALLDLLRESWIKIDRIIASNPDEWALKRITEDFIPWLNTEITVEASCLEVSKILEVSDEFRNYRDKVFWVV